MASMYLANPLNMSSKLYKTFEEVEFRATILIKVWNEFHQEITQHLPEQPYHHTIQTLSTKLEEAFSALLNELRNPTLTLATTGTTSSGKSTLVNLLCGAEIVPVAVAEMSAGVVTIEYSEEKSLFIQKTPGALWDCGEWKGISDDEIYQRLYQTMISFIDNRMKQPDLVCPQSTICYPFRFVKDSKLELPEGTKVQIMDLPGLAFVGDEGNASVIRKCRESLCIVTYNSAEVDPLKVNSLLEEVVVQVKDLGGSPSRMLFVLNRIDVFRSDRNWPATEDRFVEKSIHDIKSLLTRELKEYSKEIEALKVVKLSTWAALLALQIQNSDTAYSNNACKKADNHFNMLIEDILEDLPRNVQRWSEHDRHRVAQALQQKSYAEEFQQNLIAHITKHFPQLVIPQAIERFNVAAANEVREWAVQTTSAILNSSEENYQQECNRISQIRIDLDRFLEISDSKLTEPFERATKELETQFEEGSLKKLDKVLALQQGISYLKESSPYDQLEEKLIALYDWQRSIKKAIRQVLEAVAESLVSGKINLEGTYLRKNANFQHLTLLESNLRRLVALGYTDSVAKNGEMMEAKTEIQKSTLRQRNEELNSLAVCLSLVMGDVSQKVYEQESCRMHEAVGALFDCQIAHLEAGTNKIAENMAIKLPKSQLAVVQNLPEFKFNFQAGFEVTKGTWQESVSVAYQKRTWRTLWLIKETRYKTEYQRRESDNAKIPSVDDLLQSWTQQAEVAEESIVDQVGGWLVEQIDQLKKNVNEFQEEAIDRYQARLDQANRDNMIDYDKAMSVWLPMHQKAKKLAKEFSDFMEILK